MRLTRTLGLTLAATVVVAMAACSGGDKKDTGTTPKTVDKVNYATGFGFFGREAYVYTAIEKGYFAEAGIEVSVKGGNGTGDTLKNVSGGQIDFAPVDGTGYLLQVGGGQVKGVTAVAAIHQRSLAGIMTLDDRGITSPKDLEGKTVGDPTGSTIGLMFPMYAQLAGIDAAKVKFVNIPAQQLPAQLAAGSVNTIGQFVVGKPTIEKAAPGKKAVVLQYSDYLTDLYGNMLVTTEKMAKEKPDLVKRFSAALLKGLAYSIDHPDEAAQFLKKNQPTQDAQVAAGELQLMGAYVRGGSGPVGALDSQRVARCIAILHGANMIPSGLTPEKVVSFDLTPKA